MRAILHLIILICLPVLVAIGISLAKVTPVHASVTQETFRILVILGSGIGILVGVSELKRYWIKGVYLLHPVFAMFVTIGSLFLLVSAILAIVGL